MNNSPHKNILVISLSNIGDAILTTAVLEALRFKFPDSKISVLTSARAKQVFIHQPSLGGVIVYDKLNSLKEKIKLCKTLRGKKYNLIIDLRNSLFPIFIGSVFRFFVNIDFSKKNVHMLYKHLRKIRKIVPHFSSFSPRVYYTSQDIEYIENILKNLELRDKKFVIIAAGAKSDTKRWEEEKFTEVAEKIYRNFGMKVVLVGELKDKSILDKIANHGDGLIYNLAGGTTIPQLAYLLTKAKLLVTNDSAVLHLASAVGTPTVSIFGPTDPNKYGPLSPDSRVIITKKLKCVPCEEAVCRYGRKFCLELINPEQVLINIEEVLTNSLDIKPSYDFRKILVVRTDRVGDVLLSTPAVELLRKKFPASFIAMMVRPYTKDILKNNPWIDKIITYDKYGKDKSIFATLKFAYKLRKEKFDLSIILHPTNRAHIISFLAGIPVRIGYDRKFSFLLTHKIKHTKQLGRKHEAEYNIEVLSCLGIKGDFKHLKIFTNKMEEEWVDKLFKEEGILSDDKLIAIHPGASCPSKRWPQESFGRLANTLISKFGVKIVLISGKEDIEINDRVKQLIKYPVVDLAARLSLSELACVLKRCRLLISNDAGPVHIACGVGTPVIAIFGRNQPGLSPKRWGPTGEKDIVLHKDVGCKICLAHNCKLNFACLRAITVEDVVGAVERIGVLNCQKVHLS